MTIRFSLIAAIVALLLAVPATAQISLPRTPDLPGGLPGRVLNPVLDTSEGLTNEVTEMATRLAEDRLRRLNRLVRRNDDFIERDASGNLARRGELLVMDADAQGLAAAQAAGFSVIESGEVDGLGISLIRLRVPARLDLDEAQETVAALLPDAVVSADNLYFQSGLSESAVADSAVLANAVLPREIALTDTPVGMIDGAPVESIPVRALAGFAGRGAGQASDHGSAVASLLRSAGAQRIHAADVYGSDPAGGNALAIARALGWLAGEGAKVVTISLVGPDNPVLSRAISAARARGIVVVAAVGNDGPAAPHAYPASYAGVVAVTGVDRRERALIEAGRALGLDYAAPGADIYGLDRRGRAQRLRGTSYATPLVAARIASAMERGGNWRAAVDREAVDLGARGVDETFGRGLLCRGCGTR